jgi:hypothetical protein
MSKSDRLTVQTSDGAHGRDSPPGSPRAPLRPRVEEHRLAENPKSRPPNQAWIDEAIGSTSRNHPHQRPSRCALAPESRSIERTGALPAPAREMREGPGCDGWAVVPSAGVMIGWELLPPREFDAQSSVLRGRMLSVKARQKQSSASQTLSLLRRRDRPGAKGARRSPWLVTRA